MRRALVSFFGVLGLGTVVWANGLQERPLSPISSAKEICYGNLLILPEVQVELRLSKVQIAKYLSRIMMHPMRTLAKTIVANEWQDQPLPNFMINWEDMPQLKLSDLNEAQQKRIKELYYQAVPVNSLLSNELKKKLDLTSKQCDELVALANTVASDIHVRVLSAFLEDPRIKSELAAIKSIIKDLKGPVGIRNDRAGLLVDYEKVCIAFENDIAVKFVVPVLEATINNRSTKSAVFKILTSKQRAAFETMCGTPMKGWNLPQKVNSK